MALWAPPTTTAPRSIPGGSRSGVASRDASEPRIAAIPPLSFPRPSRRRAQASYRNRASFGNRSVPLICPRSRNISLSAPTLPLFRLELCRFKSLELVCATQPSHIKLALRFCSDVNRREGNSRTGTGGKRSGPSLLSKQRPPFSWQVLRLGVWVGVGEVS